MNSRRLCVVSVLACCLFSLGGSVHIGLAHGQQDAPANKKDGDDKKAQKTKQPPTQEELYTAFTKQMSGVKLVGRFTILGRDKNMPKEEYTIKSVRKLPAGDLWLITARIKYGNHDLTVPMPLDVKWAGDTPVITLTEVSIPGLGTFSSRVVIYNKKYAGTWTHGKVGGHLFGTIEPMEQEQESKSSESKSSESKAAEKK